MPRWVRSRTAGSLEKPASINLTTFSPKSGSSCNRSYKLPEPKRTGSCYSTGTRRRSGGCRSTCTRTLGTYRSLASTAGQIQPKSHEHLFTNIKEAREIIEEWRIDYNTNRPHSSLNGLTPIEFAARPTPGHNCSEPTKLDRFWLEFSAPIPWLGGAESDEGLEIFGRPEGVYSQARQ